MNNFIDDIRCSANNLSSSSSSTLSEWNDEVQRSFHRNHIDNIVQTAHSGASNLDMMMSDIMLTKQRIYDICNRIK